MKLTFTKDAAGALWFMTFTPERQWVQQFQYRPQNPNEMVSIARLGAWANKRLIEPETDESGKQRDTRNFLPGTWNLRSEFVDLARKMVEHYVTVPSGGLPTGPGTVTLGLPPAALANLYEILCGRSPIDESGVEEA